MCQRYLNANCGIRWKSYAGMNVSSASIGECVGQEQVHDEVWNVYFAQFKLGRLKFWALAHR